MKNLRLLGACGIYCGACDRYIATLPEGTYLTEESLKHGQDFAKNSCTGCKSTDASKIASWCKTCAIRSCAARTEVDHCGMCPKFPCSHIKFFENDGLAHHEEAFKNIKRMRELNIRPEQWLDEQEKRWKCECGSIYSCYERICHSCGGQLNGYYPDMRKK